MIKDSLLLRYLEEKPFVEMFMSGFIRLNSLDFFRGEHDEPTKEGQIDTMEGLVCPIDAKSADDCSQSEEYRYCNLLCCNRLNYFQTEHSIGWYANEDMEKFGDFVVIIKDPDAFQHRLVSAADSQHYKCLCHNVDYGNRIDGTRDVFDKEEQFAYQNEWRAALYRGIRECKPCVLAIGPIDDIAEWCYTKELFGQLTKIFYDLDFRHTDNASFGNISRIEFANLFL